MFLTSLIRNTKLQCDVYVCIAPDSLYVGQIMYRCGTNLLAMFASIMLKCLCWTQSVWHSALMAEQLLCDVFCYM